MKLDKLFHVLVMGGAVLTATGAGCGGRPGPGSSSDSTSSVGSGSSGPTATDGGTNDPDGGVDETPGSCGVCCWLGGN